MAVVGVSAALNSSLSSVCTVSYVQSVLPASEFITGITINVDSVTTNTVTNYSVASSNLYPAGSGLNFCNVTFSYTHDGSDGEATNLWYWLPAPSEFQNRYLSSGGGGFSISSGSGGLSQGLVFGAATGTTDGGFGSWSAQLTDVLLKANGTLNYDALYAFGYKAIHEMSVLGKELTRKFYGIEDFYSYYQGCSEGGREGWSQVQRFGSQFDGAAIGAPAFRQAFQQVNHLFPAVAETLNNYAPSKCELTAINNATIAACDGLDGIVDGVVSRTDLCKTHFDLDSVLGRPYSCAATIGGIGGGGAPGKRKRQMGGGAPSPAVNGTVSAGAINIAKILLNGLRDSKGRQVYIPFQPVATFGDAAATYNSTTGGYSVSASGIGNQFVDYLLNEVATTSIDLSTVDYDKLRSWMLQALQKFQDSIETTWPDLEDFQTAGGKVIHFHGESDDSVPTASSVRYYESVRSVMYPKLSYTDSVAALDDWYRLFLIPGAGHCAPSTTQPAPFPQNVFGSLIEWVEGGVNPTLLNATVESGANKGAKGKICSYPLRPYWTDGVNMDCVYDQSSVDSFTYTLDSIPVPVY
ncbi:tannase and feruloyl esterase [Pseudovirgaria hyperparasitica]|uniref:Carboxylic ester hydrolase n=1 Tax=Pseudovirgaria hyperparasitica TaxID=470096 RepID=A0A6A6WGW3_9PEZI|nr:tannase and feruloyl esterase [Pseudovirgaria hyperparasitica]KAF2760391.1 tannase and feruloyl esterase [Pseudovirgaria hyperparasitica]